MIEVTCIMTLLYYLKTDNIRCANNNKKKKFKR